jgi:glycosyltransferase involved in cell wall biosynthesis
MSGVAFANVSFNPHEWPMEPDGVAYYRNVLPASVLEGRVNVGPPAWTGADGFGVITGPNTASFGYDTVVLKGMHSRGIPHQMTMAQALGQRLIADVDDLYDDLPEWHPAAPTWDPTKAKVSNTEYFIQTLMQADAVTVSTQFLHDRYSQMRDNVHLIRNAVNLDVMTQHAQSGAKPVIGWAGQVGKRPADIESLRWWLPEFLESNDLMFHHSGDDGAISTRSFAEAAGFSAERITTIHSQAIEFYFKKSLTFDIGIVPLVDEPFNRAKSFLKGLEYAASGIPFVAQALPEYEYLFDQGIGRIAYSPEDWVEQLTALLNPKIRKAEAAANLALVKRHHTMESTADEWRAVLQG